MFNMIQRLALAFSWVFAFVMLSTESSARVASWDSLSNYNVVWNTPSPDSTGSMPLGNGDIGLNVWVEKNGDLMFYIGKTDAWGLQPDENDPKKTQMALLKVGRVRVSLSPTPKVEGNPFRQELDLQKAEVRVTMGEPSNPTRLRVWVDANRPVIHVQAQGAGASTLKASVESWRIDPAKKDNADVFVPDQKDRVVWYFYHPGIPTDYTVTGETFGAAVIGAGLAATDIHTVTGTAARSSWQADVHVLTVRDVGPEAWLPKLDQQISRTNQVAAPTAEREHAAWWDAFWHRSWIYVDGQDGYKATQSYALQRFITACAARGAYPMKFNGSIFVSDYPQTFGNGPKPLDKPANADFRKWGDHYWFQNTRLPYWTMLASGDFDMMSPLFDMYRTHLLRNRDRVRMYYGHDGSVFQEFSGYWGYLGKVLPEDKAGYVTHYYLPVLELTAMGLDYYDYTSDDRFLHETLLPIAMLGVTFYDEHFKRDEKGKLLISPVNAVESFWKTKNPSPDIAALRSILPRLLKLPPGVVPESERTRWQRLLTEVPELPTATKDGKTTLRPAEEFGERKNSENPEMYAVFPFRLFGVGKPDLALARDSFAARAVKNASGWHPDAVMAAFLGEADEARAYTLSMFSNKDLLLRFPAFWGRPNTPDYWPDQDNGANAVQALQRMLLQADDGKIQLLPAWPIGWNVRFKLHAPQDTTIEGSFIDGKLRTIVVTPASRRKDVMTVLGVPAQLP